MKKRIKSLSPAAPSAGQEQNVVVLIVTPIEADKIYAGLGKLPAEAVEDLRGKFIHQANSQRELIRSFCAQPSVQQLMAEPDDATISTEPKN